MGGRAASDSGTGRNRTVDTIRNEIRQEVGRQYSTEPMTREELLASEQRVESLRQELETVRSRSAETRDETFKVSSSGYLPQDMEANSEQEVIQRFNEANANPEGDGRGYRFIRSTRGGYDGEIAPTLNGKLLPKNQMPRRRVSLYKKSNGKWSFI